MNRRTRFAVAVVLVLGLAVPIAQSASAGSTITAVMACKGTGRIRTCGAIIPASARVHVRSPEVTVVVPADYDRARSRYPVVYVLHGVGDNDTSWTNPQRGDLAALTASCKAIFVMPDGGGGTTAGWYSDWKDGSYQYETFHTKILPRNVDDAFRTLGPSRRAIAGLSMGGFGALSYTARHPGMFRATASYSAFADSLFGAPASGAFYQAGGQNPIYSLGTPSKGVWGDQGADRATWAAHNPYDLVAKLRGQPLFLSSGHGAPGGSQGDDATKAPAYVTEAYVGQLNDRFATALKDKGIAYTDAREQGGRHDWPYWRASFTKSLKVLMPALGAASPGCGR